MNNNQDQHHIFMRQAIKLSYDNVIESGGPFGAVIVHDGYVVATGVNRVTRDNDPTAHAEVNAIRSACQQRGTYSLTGCVLYTSCEPCPMCLGAVYWARLDGIYFANTRHDAAAINFDDSFIYQEINKEITMRSIPAHQLLRDEALKAFELWQESIIKRPY
jgi:guanine deaminase